MRICDKCHERLIETTLIDEKYKEQIDLCKDCRQIFADWIFNPDRKKENDPVEPDKKTPRRNK